jgi:hypothetical protein
MLKSLKGKLKDNNLNTKIFKKDLKEFSCRTKFDGAIISKRTLNYITEPEGQRKALKNVANILKKGAIVVIDLAPSRPISFCKSQEKLVKTDDFVNAISGKKVEMWETWKADPLKQTWDMVYEFREGSKKCRVNLKMRAIFIQELKYLLELSGLKLLDIYGSYKKDSFTLNSGDLIVVAQKK